MSRGIANPLFAAATSVLKEGQRFRSWYNSGIEWYTLGEEQRVRYGIHYAESSDGINWTYSPGLRIPFSDHQEHSFGRPSVIVENGVYHMWFSSRGAAGESNYRIGYAYSSDGIEWTREDSRFRFDRPSKDEEFDSLAQAYPSVFSHGGLYYMLYSGNAYGLTGSGYAVCEAVA